MVTFLYLCMLFGMGDLVTPTSGDKISARLYDSIPGILPGTKALTLELTPGEVSVNMLNGAHRLIDKKINESVASRSALWNRNFASREAYELSVEPNRKQFMQYIGVVDKNIPPDNFNVGFPDTHPPVSMQKIAAANDPVLVAETEKYEIYQVRWPVLNRVHGEGLLLQPKSEPIANIIALPDADQTPEQLVGLTSGISPESQFARRLAENGFQVLIPVGISRELLLPEEKHQQSNREWIFRQAFHMGRHPIGYEVQKVMSAIDWFEQSAKKEMKIGVVGYAEGGLLSLYSAAIDSRIDAVLVSGYFNSRQQVWDEPIYRNVWGLLTEFGVAEIASLIAPRTLVVEHSKLPEALVKATKKPNQLDEYSYTGYKGQLMTPSFDTIEKEFNRINGLVEPGFQNRFLVNNSGESSSDFGSEEALKQFARALGITSALPISDILPSDNRSDFDPTERQINQVKELEDHVQWLLRDSDNKRDLFFLYQVMPEWNKRPWSTKRYHQYFSPEHFLEEGEKYRKYFREEILGNFDEPYLPPNARSRKIYDKELWTGYGVFLDVYEDFIAPGVMLIPKDIRKGEKRPVVVVQHGRNGVPQDLIEGNTSYYDMAAKLADQGFVVYAPYGLFSGEDRYRWLDRKANSIKKSLFSFTVAQHEQTLNWLGTLPFVDSSRIAFYGKSYGGETAMRIPAVLEGYALSICSADFGDWSRKVIDTHYHNSFMNTIEWEMPYFNMGSTFSYAEMAYLIFPRPFMVERGHHDLVQPDEWVAYEYAKVKFLFDQFNLADNTEIEYFNGGHASRNEGTFKFLHKHLDWP